MVACMKAHRYSCLSFWEWNMSWQAQFLRRIDLPDQDCWEISVPSCATAFGLTVLLLFRCADKAGWRREPQGRSGGALHVWTMGHSLWRWLDWWWCWGRLPTVGIQVCVCVAQSPQPAPIPSFWACWHSIAPGLSCHGSPLSPPPTVTLTRVAAYLLMGGGVPSTRWWALRPGLAPDLGPGLASVTLLPHLSFVGSLCGPSLVWSFTLDQMIPVGLHMPRLTEALHHVPPENKDIINQPRCDS